MKRVSRTPSNIGSGFTRIIAGQWRGRKLPVAAVEGLRPTTDRNKETLFNWLMHDISGADCLDAFAGTGGLGIEALSRYAKSCTFIEKNAAAAGTLQKNLQVLRASANVLVGDSLTVLPDLKTPYDIIFIDPPFHKQLVNPTLAAIFTNNLIKEGGLIYIEQEANAPAMDLPSRCNIIKQKNTSQLTYCLVRC